MRMVKRGVSRSKMMLLWLRVSVRMLKVSWLWITSLPRLSLNNILLLFLYIYVLLRLLPLNNILFLLLVLLNNIILLLQWISILQRLSWGNILMLLLWICSLRGGLSSAKLRERNSLPIPIQSGFGRCGCNSCLRFIRSLRSLVLIFL